MCPYAAVLRPSSLLSLLTRGGAPTAASGAANAAGRAADAGAPGRHGHRRQARYARNAPRPGGCLASCTWADRLPLAACVVEAEAAAAAPAPAEEAPAPEAGDAKRGGQRPAFVNRVTLIGNAAQVPTFGKFSEDSEFASFSVATSRSYKDASGTLRPPATRSASLGD